MNCLSCPNLRKEVKASIDEDNSVKIDTYYHCTEMEDKHFVACLKNSFLDYTPECDGEGTYTGY